MVKGTWPPIQRNLGIKKATGGFIFLFDDDIEITAGIIEKVLAKFERNPGISVIGGPNLTPPGNDFLQHCFGFAHGSWFTAGKTSARYSPAKENLIAGEDNLISCNLAFRAEILKENPFDPSVFPNEENDLLGRMSSKGVRMMYTPDFFVYHHRRKSFAAYLRQIFNWGKGRMKRTVSKPESFSPMFFVPLAFLVYLVSLPFYPVFWFLLPLGLYLLLDIWFSAEAALKGKHPGYIPVMLLIFPLTHIFYALGLVWGLPAGLSAHRATHVKSTVGRKHARLPDAKSMQLIEIRIS